MTTPEALFDAVGFNIGTGHQGGGGVVAVRFHLRDGQMLGFSLQPELATALALQMLQTLQVLADEPMPEKH
jgi:hypothetical protein